MKNHRFRFLSAFLVVFFLFVSQVYAYWVWSPTEGRFVSPQSTADNQKTAEELFQSALKLREQKGKDRDIIRMLQQVVRNHTQSAYAPEAQFLIASIFEEQEKPLRAAAEFKKVVREFPRSPRIEEAMDHLFKIGDFFLTGEKQKIIGMAIIPVYSKAVDIFKFIVEQAPYGSYGDQSQLKLGVAYRKMANFSEAVNAFQTLIANYPTSPLIDEAHYQLAETSYELAQNTIRDQSVTSQASLHLKDFIKQYKTSSLAERAELLKQRLDEQDAEKNYRIGLYYEKQGSIESAQIYYEDVAEHYSETPFGKKAARRLRTLEQPIRAMEKGEAAIEQRIAEVRSMLEALEREEQKKGKKAVSETGELKEQLKQELTSLMLGQKKFKTEAWDNFDSRRRTFREREKSLREKFKIFKSRKKQLLKNPSPELQKVINQWNASLIAEEEELAHERQTLSEIKSGFRKQKISEPQKRSRMFDWLPHKKKVSEKQVPAEIIGFDPKKWNKFQKERAEIAHRRQTNEERLREIAAEFQNVQGQEFDFVKNIPNLDQLLPADLLKEKENFTQKKLELDQSLQAFEQMKKEFEGKFGPEFIKSLSNNSYVSKSAAAHSLVASGEDLDRMLNQLQTEQVSLSEAWLAETEQQATMAKAFDESKSGQKQADKNLAIDENGAAMDQAQQTRFLKKRMKYLEREIRSRIDQIQDWERDNAKRMRKLNQLLKPEVQSKMSKTAEKMLTPAKGTYKLTKAFLFGLENNEQKLMEQAAAEITKSETEGSLTNEHVGEIRELQEEIELQSVLIQGRNSEINDFQARLDELGKQAKIIPGFSYQSLLIKRIPTDLAHSVIGARKLIGFGTSEADILKRLDAQSKKLSDLGRQITENSNQIEIVNLAIDQKKGVQSNQQPSVLPFVSGDTEMLPQEGSVTQEDEQNKAQAKLIQAKAEINIRQSAYQQAESAYHEKLLHWFQTAGEDKIGEKISGKLKNLSSQKSRLQEKEKEIQTLQSELLKKENAVVQAQKELADQKLNELDDRLEKLNNPSDSAYQALMSEIKNAQELRDSLIHDLSTLQSS